MGSWHQVVEIKAAVAESGDEFLDRARAALDIWGGMSSSVQRDDELNAEISFDPATAEGGIAGIVAWCDSLSIEYSLTLHRWAD